MSDMKCPFCQQELESVLRLAGAGGLVEEAYLLCSKCDIRGEKKLWRELIHTREALDVAKNAINSAADHNIINCVARGIDPRTDDVSVILCNALEQIIALKQKD